MVHVHARDRQARTAETARSMPRSFARFARARRS
jgi:hypothetical protein